jgi:hypothetical protein
MSGGPSLQGQGIASNLEGFPGEDVIALSDPNSPPPGLTYFGQNNPVQDNDFHVSVNAYIDATQAWRQIVTLPSVPTGACVEGNFSGCAATTNNFAADALNRHWGRTSPWANDPIAPGWCVGDDYQDGKLCVASVAAVNNGSAVICIPSAAPQPNSGDIIVFPYLTPAFKTTIGSQTTCSGGTQFTMGAVYPGATSTQQEFMAGSGFQTLNAGISSSSTSLVGNLNVYPQWWSTSNVGSHGLIKIDSEQMTYRVVANESNTFLNLVRGVNGTTAASHSGSALIVPLNPVVPTRPWPVVPSITPGTATTPVGAEYYPAGAVGNAAYSMPLLSGSNVAYVGLADGSYLHNITIDTVGGVGDTTNNSAGLWISQLPYSVQINRLFITGTDFGSVMGPPTNNTQYMTQQSSCNSISWDKITIRSYHGWYNLCGGQANFSNMDIYNTQGVVGWAQWAEPGDQGLGALFGGGDTIFNVYNEDLNSSEGVTEPEDTLFASNDTINNAQWIQSNIFTLVGNGNTGSNINFPNGSAIAPVILYGSGNKLAGTGALGPATQNSNVWGTGTVLNYGNLGGNNVEGTVPGGVFQNLSFIGRGSRALAGFQTAESAFLGNVTTTNQVLDLNAGLIYPGEINIKSSGRPTGMDGLVTDFNAPFNAAVYCQGATGSCVPQDWVICDQICKLAIAAGSRIVPTTYTVYIPYRTNTGTPTSVITLQVWTGGTPTNVATTTVTNSTSWQTLEFDSVNLSSYSGYTLGLAIGSFSSSTANYYIGGVEFSPIAQKLIVNNLVVDGTCSGCGGGGGGSTIFQVNGTGLASSTTVNFQNGANVAVTNPSAGNISIAVPTATNSVLGVAKPDASSIAVSAGVLSINPTGANTIAGFNASNVYSGYAAGTNISIASGLINDTNPANTVAATLTSGTFPVATGAAAIANSNLSQSGATLSWNPGSGSSIIGTGTSSNTDGAGVLAVSGTSVTYSFVNTYTVHPVCMGEMEGTTPGITHEVSYTGVASFTMTFSSSFTGNFDYHCYERN